MGRSAEGERQGRGKGAAAGERQVTGKGEGGGESGGEQGWARPGTGAGRCRPARPQ